MTRLSHRHYPERHGRSGSVVAAAVLIGIFCLQAPAQEATCPCFSLEEVESIYAFGIEQATAGGAMDCQSSDYNVECNAEIIVWDQNYKTLAQARVEWFDFDPGRCVFIDARGETAIERSERWPHPAPEDIARACFDIITGILARGDPSAMCMIYP